ncbi:MAG: hypothetical protein ACR2HQ_12025 [Ilumatobacteraceae bacterium]
MNLRLDWDAIRAGGVVSLVFAVPFSVAARWAADNGDRGLATGLVLVAIIGFLVGGGCAAWVQRVDAPLTHGVVTAGGTYLLAQAVFVTVRLVRGMDVQWFAIVFNLTAATFAGLLGGLLGQRLRSRGFVPSSRSRPQQ